MYLIECLPFSKGLNKESLSYFGPKYVEPGSLIKVSVRNKLTAALVLESRDAAEAKAEIRSADFQLKKMGAVASKPFLQKEFLEVVKATADYFAASPGSLLAHLIPAVVIENPNLLSLPTKGTFSDRLAQQSLSDVGDSSKVPFNNSERKIKNEILVLQSPDEERFSLFRSLIREEFAKKKSVFLCLPQNESLRQAKEILERGIEAFVCVLHGEMSKKEIAKELKKAVSSEHPVLIIATARWLFLPRADIGAIVLDKENDNGWKTLSRPFFDLRFFAEALAKKKNVRCILADSFLRTETLHRYKQGEIAEFESVKWRLPAETETQVADMREVNKKDLPAQAAKEFRVLSPQLLKLIERTAAKSSHLFLFASRKGLSSVTVCRDCGEQVRCNNCGSPMILYKTKNGNVFKCHQCGETRDASETCQNCGSWKLAAFGAGVDRVAEEIRKNFPKLPLFEVHKDVTTTGSKALAETEKFYETRGSVLVGTEMAFSYLRKKVANSAIASFDSLFSVPDFRIREKIFRLILQTKSLAKENFLIQTRNPSDPTIQLALSGNLAEFYKRELEDRQALSYPPFSVFVKVTVRGTKSFTAKESEKLAQILTGHNPAIFPSIHEKRGEQSAVNAVIKLPTSQWPQDEILSILKSLPPHFEIKVDPDNLL